MPNSFRYHEPVIDIGAVVLGKSLSIEYPLGRTLVMSIFNLTVTGSATGAATKTIPRPSWGLGECRFKLGNVNQTRKAAAFQSFEPGEDVARDADDGVPSRRANVHGVEEGNPIRLPGIRQGPIRPATQQGGRLVVELRSLGFATETGVCQPSGQSAVKSAPNSHAKAV